MPKNAKVVHAEPLYMMPIEKGNRGCFLCGRDRAYVLSFRVDDKKVAAKLVKLAGGKNVAQVFVSPCKERGVKTLVYACEQHWPQLEHLHDLASKRQQVSDRIVAKAREFSVIV